MSRKVVNRIMFDHDALETFLICETDQQPGFQKYYLIIVDIVMVIDLHAWLFNHDFLQWQYS